MSKATATFEVTNWDERPAVQADGGSKVTQASVTMSFSGDLEGDGSVEWLMAYAGDENTASFVGLERVVGTLDGRDGTFVLQHTGTFDGAVAKAELAVVDGSGTGDLTGLTGTGAFEAGMGSDGTRRIELVYDF